MNNSIDADYNEQLNIHARVRDYLLTYLANLPHSTMENIQLQASVLSQLTKSSNELTRNAIVKKHFSLNYSLLVQYRHWYRKNVMKSLVNYKQYSPRCPMNIFEYFSIISVNALVMSSP